MNEGGLNYILCSNPRSGTTLLCDMLARSGVAGRPDSFFQERYLKDWCDAWGLAVPADVADRDFGRRYLAATLSYIGQDGSIASGVAVGLSKLADKTSADWIAHFRHLHPEA